MQVTCLLIQMSFLQYGPNTHSTCKYMQIAPGPLRLEGERWESEFTSVPRRLTHTHTPARFNVNKCLRTCIFWEGTLTLHSSYLRTPHTEQSTLSTHTAWLNLIYWGLCQITSFCVCVCPSLLNSSRRSRSWLRWKTWSLAVWNHAVSVAAVLPTYGPLNTSWPYQWGQIPPRHRGAFVLKRQQAVHFVGENTANLMCPLSPVNYRHRFLPEIGLTEPPLWTWGWPRYIRMSLRSSCL